MKQSLSPVQLLIKLLSFSSASKIAVVLLSGYMLCTLQARAQDVEGDAKPKKILPPLAQGSALSLQLGGNAFFGDLGGTKGKGRPFVKDLNLKTTHLFAGLSYTYFGDTWWSVNGDLHFTSVSSADSIIDKKIGNALGRFQRNLSFKSFIYELQATAEFYPLQLINEQGTTRWMPYIGTGLGVFHFNPKTKLNGEWYYLQPLRLEGQGFPEYPERKEYKLTQMYIPFAAGVKYRINESYIVSLNALFRKTFTDYIDDVSTTYINPALFDQNLTPFTANLAKQLYYRGTVPQTPDVNDIRGYSGNDSYTSVFISVTYLLNNSGGGNGRGSAGKKIPLPQ
jgi:hypothetical protein